MEGMLFELVEKGFDLVSKSEHGSSLLQSILLCLIWLNVRSLKNVIAALEVNHNKRIGEIEIKVENHEGRLTALEK